MARLVIVVDVDGIDVTLVDPHEPAEGIVSDADDTERRNGTDVRYTFVSAGWDPDA